MKIQRLRKHNTTCYCETRSFKTETTCYELLTLVFSSYDTVFINVSAILKWVPNPEIEIQRWCNFNSHMLILKRSTFQYVVKVIQYIGNNSVDIWKSLNILTRFNRTSTPGCYFQNIIIMCFEEIHSLFNAHGTCAFWNVHFYSTDTVTAQPMSVWMDIKGPSQ